MPCSSVIFCVDLSSFYSFYARSNLLNQFDLYLEYIVSIAISDNRLLFVYYVFQTIHCYYVAGPLQNIVYIMAVSKTQDLLLIPLHLAFECPRYL